MKEQTAIETFTVPKKWPPPVRIGLGTHSQLLSHRLQWHLLRPSASTGDPEWELPDFAEYLIISYLIDSGIQFSDSEFPEQSITWRAFQPQPLPALYN